MTLQLQKIGNNNTKEFIMIPKTEQFQNVVM